MPPTYLPTRDADLLNWSNNFNDHLKVNFASYGLSAAQQTAYEALHLAYAEAYATIQNQDTRTPGAIQAKRDARHALINGENGIRKLVKIIQAFPGTNNEMRVDLKITVPDVEPTPVPPPSSPPQLSIVSVFGRSVKMTLRDAVDKNNRGMPKGVDGATVLSYVGENPPQGASEWSFQFSTTRTSVDVNFPETVPAGSKVWLTAFWFNQRKQTGPAAPPQSTNIAGGVAMAA